MHSVNFYVLLNVHPRIISQINPTRCTILFNIFIYFSSLHVSGIHAPSSGENYCIYAALALVSMSHKYSNFLLMTGAWMPETCREEK